MTAQSWRRCGLVIGIHTTLLSSAAAAQELPGPAVEIGAGWAAFVDESPVNHSVFSGAARFHLTPRVSLGPELSSMIGPGEDRDTLLLGNIYFDFLPPVDGRPPRVSPLVVAGGGLFQHRNRFRTSTSTHNGGTFAGGAGVRISVTDRFYVAPDVRIGVEDLHMRATVSAGIRLGS